MGASRTMKAIDLYSGVGGWSLGLSMAAVEVVGSYEWWKEANLTNFRNNLHESECVDIRSISPSSLPAADVVVGSPPCTHFSLANRGGKGNIMEGLKDVEKFLEIVEFLKPSFWAMENVPRLSAIMCKEFNQGGVLNRFCHLNPNMMVLDASEWGIPQRRQRLVVGNFDFDLLLSYRISSPTRTLGDVVSSLSSDPVFDPVYGTRVSKDLIVDHDEEQPFSLEEERINREAKTHHPVYNNMSFPDSMERPSRTITATCTRISRESVVVPCEGGFRRPTLREQASIQSFPLDYQFYGETHAQKQKMIGNAIPPLLTYHIAHAMLGTKASELPLPSSAILNFSPPSAMPKRTIPDRPAYSFTHSRKFRFAVPNLRFKSGVRFELTNSLPGGSWGLRFFYGNSKDIKEITLGSDLLGEMRLLPGVDKCISDAKKIVSGIGKFAKSSSLQKAWSHSEKDTLNPFEFLDTIGSAALASSKKNPSDLSVSAVSGIMASRGNPGGFKKLIRHAPDVFAGLLVCSLVNDMFTQTSLLESKS